MQAETERSRLLDPPSQADEPPTLPVSLLNTLSLDLEVNPKSNEIIALAAIRPDTGEEFKARGPITSRHWQTLDRMAENAAHLTGHNIAAFDIHHLRAAAPHLNLLRKPVLDTLMLNPLAFPRYPYHRLVKHYKDGGLVRNSRNDPLLDSRLTMQALKGQFGSLKKARPELLSAWHWLATRKDGEAYDTCFAQVRGLQRPTDEQGMEAIQRFLTDRSCRAQTKAVAEEARQDPWPLAYVMAWLDAEGTNSAIPPWVVYNFPVTSVLTTRLRERNCGNKDCGWCQERNDPKRELKRWFRFDSFRAEPAGADGVPLQERLTSMAMEDRNTLGILPTGTGKSICYQLPALSRYDKTGALTVVVSPLVALMADQIAGLQEKGISNAVTVNSLLSLPERKDALDKIRLGEASMVILSPESLRSRSVRTSLEQRRIGSYVLDEAHCLSKWGHDFRPDYRYIAKFVKRLAAGNPPPPVLCLTATAKPDVKEEIHQYFRDQLGMELETVDGGSQRRNLEFDILKTEPQHKMAHLKEVIDRYLPGQEGGAIIYRATRSAAKETADYLNGVSISSDYFHGGLTPERKKQAQEDFIQGRTRTICATNAFGMGIDKPDIRLVVHADIPGSLENYIQEAGRAGRDQEEAWCVLLYNPEDTERQHSLQAANSLTEDQINAFLKSVKSLDEKNNRNTPDGGSRQPVIATTGEILKEDEQGEFDSAGENDDTRGRTAVAWLEETEILDRQENVVSIFPACVTVPDMSEARRRIYRRGHNSEYAAKLAQLANRILNADPVQGISTDELSAITGLTFRELRKALTELNAAGVTRDDTAITLYIHQGTSSPSARRFTQADAMESTLIALMAESAPDQQQGETFPLHIRQATQDLKDREHPTALPLHTERIIRSLARTGRETPANTPNIRARAAGDETLRITLLTSWRDLEQGAAQRRLAARGILRHLRGKLQPGERGNDLLVATTSGELTEAMRLEGALSPATEPSSLLQQALLWLHELEVVRLNQGMTILRPAMTIEVKDRTRKFESQDYEPLQIHYDEQTFQVHIMAEYAEKGLDSVANALRLALDYFTMSKEQFNARWMADRRKQAQLSRRTTPESYRRIVESLNNRNQREAVTDNRKTRDILLLAGPGSGKTRTLVHRIAYLVRVRREDPRSIIALAYNRHAAVQIRHRLEELIGAEARAVTTMTCHALAMRLTGRTYQNHAARTATQADKIFSEILNEASSYLEGQGAPEGEDNDLREKMLRGFRWILVDEYQDINEETYRLISALAGRSRREQDEKLRLFAVGDDDQNVYAYDGSSNEYIKRFQNDYPADVRYLTENYRSTRHIIDAANAVIAPASGRMKKDRDITIDRVRTMEPPGGSWSRLDPVANGKVQVLNGAGNDVQQAQLAFQELQRLAGLNPDWRWDQTAVIARNWDTLEPLRAIGEAQGIEVQSAQEDFTATWQLRETQELLKWAESQQPLVSAINAVQWARNLRPGRWQQLVTEAMETLALETQERGLTNGEFREWLSEWARGNRRRQRGLLLTSAHSAKGLEFDHVVILDGNWQPRGKEAIDESRRLYYVAMTRAKQTLTLLNFGNQNPFIPLLKNHEAVIQRDTSQTLVPTPPEALSRAARLTLRDVDLSFAGRSGRSTLHQTLAALHYGDPLTVDVSTNPWVLKTPQGVTVGRLSQRGQRENAGKAAGGKVTARVLAMARWSKKNSEGSFQDRLQREEWEVVIPELVFTPENL